VLVHILQDARYLQTARISKLLWLDLNLPGQSKFLYALIENDELSAPVDPKVQAQASQEQAAAEEAEEKTLKFESAIDFIRKDLEKTNSDEDKINHYL